MPAVDEALHYAESHWLTFPLAPRSKVPLIAGGNGFQDATLDEHQIREWWTRAPDANIGIRCGLESVLVVIDIDPRNGGDAAWQALAEEHGAPETLTARTGGGGLHLYFRHPGGAVKWRKQIARGVDVQADGRYVAAPPSVHPSGGVYTWIAGVTVAPMPAWLLEMARQPPPPAAKPRQPNGHASDDILEKRARAYLATLPSAISGQQGHDAAWAVAIALTRGYGLDEPTARRLFLEDYNPRCEPPWSEREVDHKIRDAANKGDLPIGYIRDAERPMRPNGHAGPPPSQPPPPREPSSADGEPAEQPAAEPRQLRSRSYLSAVTIVSDNTADILDGKRLEYDAMAYCPALDRVPMQDVDMSRIRSEIERRIVASRDKQGNPIGLTLSRDDVHAAVLQVAHGNQYHPVREYLRALTWDGEPRLARVAVDVLRAKPTRLNVTMVRSWFLCAVARPLTPGCKVDTVLVLVGPQGCGKSSTFRILAGQWFVDTAIDIGNKDALMTIGRAWILEWAELEALARARDAGAVKAFLTSSDDVYRPPFARLPIRARRSGVIVGSTNNVEFLADETGNRRFWPLEIGSVNLTLLAAWRDQLWAEAVALYDNGARWWLSPDDETDLEEVHETHAVTDAWATRVIAYATSTYEPTTADILDKELRKPAGQWSRGDEMRVAKILTRAGWRREKRHRGARVWLK